jgi:signal transduction histidine kinase
MWRTIREEKKPYSAELINRRKNGELYDAELHISPVLNESGDIQYFIGVERDITKANEIDKAKDEFISLASHQMRTPLTAINWYVEMLLDGDGGNLSKKQKEYFQAIRTAGQQINEIIKSFLHILRLEAGTVVMSPVPVRLEDVARAILKESQLDIEKKKLRVVERYQEALPTMSVDMELIRVVMQNLISNAVKYTSAGSEVTVAMQNVSQGEIVAKREVGQSSVLVSVRDTGIGIPRADHDKIFTKFFRSESAKRWDPNGNGIGLYMTKKMVDTIGGVIWFDSEEGKGTTFYVLLPVEEKKVDTIPTQL